MGGTGIAAAATSRFAKPYMDGLNWGASPSSAERIAYVDNRVLNVSLGMSGVAARNPSEFGQLAVQAIRAGVNNDVISKDWVNRA